ncbi:DUF4081 domain-containing protein [Aggregicoccus sp. 17bor-14]|uniref:GNAT family N-acetyltransferase n=1 Tax=Myxococcaceae TaxID=31 RepID=UPI00129C1BC9|nr:MULTISPECIES: DUF4081 domain-containing protein [Myxococcaceae]MBF5046547.1 DUF4081 domain-containing protein [Simulacricoccus sp. 17bor-14]MRI92258.1 DUF4081 domain-containing protein [Aggregicoccus sp. 17bor-14]
MSSSIEQLGPSHAEALRALLSKDPVHHLYLLGLAEEYGLEARPGPGGSAFWGRFEAGALTGVLFVGGGGGLLVPSALDAAAVGAFTEALGKDLRVQACLGEKPAVDALMRALCPRTPRLSRVQRLFGVSADDLGPFTNPTLRLAREEDLPRLLPLALGAVREGLERDPLADGAGLFEARVRRRVRARRTYVLEEAGALVFKVDVGSRSQHGAELEGLYTLPGQRRKGHATLCLGQISRHLLSSLPRLTLRVDEQNASLAGIARKVGFVPGRPQRLVLVD